MLLKYVYFLSLLLCIPFSGEEYLKSRKRFHRLNKRNGHYKRKNNYLEDDKSYADKDKEPMAYIDVASFIQSPDDSSIDTGQTFDQLLENRKQAINDMADNSLLNSDMEEENEQSRDYQRLESNSMPEVNIYNRKTVPRYVNKDIRPAEDININEDFKNANYESHRNIENNKHYKKKCALKNMKIPFFSHKKSTTKKNKKRKLFASHNSRQNSNVTKVTGSNLKSKNSGRISAEQQKSFKVNKRSYFERLCPECKKKFIQSSSSDWLNKCRKTANSMIHNSRQYYQNIIGEDNHNDNISKTSNSATKHTKNLESIGNSDSFNGRWKRNDQVLEKENILNSSK